MKTVIAIIFAYFVNTRNKKWISKPIQSQNKTFKKLIKSASNTEFGQKHDFQNIYSHEQYQKRVPVRDYEQLKPYIEKAVAGYISCPVGERPTDT